MFQEVKEYRPISRTRTLPLNNGMYVEEDSDGTVRLCEHDGTILFQIRRVLP